MTGRGIALAAGAAAAAAAVFWWVLRVQPPPPAAGTPVPPPVAVAPSLAAPAAPITRPAAAAPERIEAQGVLQRRNSSEALLSVDRGPAQIYPVGAEVADGWRVAAVAGDHVMLARGSEQVRLDFVAAPRTATPLAAASAKPPPETAPGFVPGRVPPNLPPPGTSPESNQRFRQEHMRAPNPASRQAPQGGASQLGAALR